MFIVYGFFLLGFAIAAGAAWRENP